MPRRAFTLLELLVTIAITGILAAMIFSNFSSERYRNNLKASVRQLQIDIQAMQTNAQAGVVLPGTSVVPNGYGVVVETTPPTTYKLFADQTGGTTSIYDPGELLRLRTLPGTDNDISLIVSASPLNIVFTRPNGSAVITPPPVSPETSSRIIIKSDKLKICYAITVTTTVGTVSNRKLALCP